MLSSMSRILFVASNLKQRKMALSGLTNTLVLTMHFNTLPADLLNDKSQNITN